MIREATGDDATALAELLFRSPQAGRMVLGQDRTPDPFARRAPYDQAFTAVVDGADGLAATGTCALKTVLVGGEPTRVGYVFDVAVSASSRGRGLARAVLESLESWSAQRDAALVYAHILRGNRASLGTFEACGYRIACDLTGRVYPVFRDHEVPAHLHPIEDWGTAAEQIRSQGAPYDLVRPLDGAALRSLWTSLPGWCADDAWATDGSVLGLWDYRPVARSVPLRLTPEVRALGVLGRVARRLRVPFPRAPELGRPMSYGLVLGGAGEEAELRTMLRAAIGRAGERGIDVVLFFHDARRRPAWTKAAFSVTDSYHLMTKEQAPESPRLGDQPVWVDPADL